MTQPIVTQPIVSALRGIEIGVPDLSAAETFYTDTWHLQVVERLPNVVYLRGTGAAHHILTLHAGVKSDVRAVVFNVSSEDAFNHIVKTAPEFGGAILTGPMNNAAPGGGRVLTIHDPQGRLLKFVHGDERHVDVGDIADRPKKITHVVLNSTDVASSQKFFETVLGFKLSDRTRIMAFMRCGADHHSIALADADNNCLNHIAFLMPDLDSVMRGGGRMRDADFPIEWGVGRHGPGNNAFAYFVGPFDFVIEYTAEVQQVDDSYKTGGPEDWKWPPGRIDQWGIGTAPSTRLKTAQRAIPFVR
jgi:catechol 2,3-dioxygenase